MRLREFSASDDGIWGSYTFETTWPMGWNVILEMANTLIKRDFVLEHVRVGNQTEMIDVTEELAGEDPDIFATKATNENGGLVIIGRSRLMECPIQMTLLNQTRIIGMSVPLPELPEEVRGDGEVFTHYMSGIEINAYMAIAERNARASDHQ